MFLVSLAGGCASVQNVEPPLPVSANGTYHKMQKGETLWRVAKSYGVEMDDIIKSNNIPDAAHVEENQLVLIPRPKQDQFPAPPPPAPVVSQEDFGAKEEFGWPLRGKILNYFGERTGAVTSRGVGISGQEGQTVFAARRGKVVFADYLAGYAYTVILDHADGFFSVYSHNEKLLVKLGDLVAKGQGIAQLGKQGKLAFLHFEIRKQGRADNPLYYLPQN